MSKRATFALLAAALAVVLALVACGEGAPSPTAEPTPASLSAAQEQMPTPTSTPTPSHSSVEEEQTLPSPGDIDTQRDCDQTPGINSYDIASVSTAPHYHWVYDIRVSGEDYHIRITMLEQDGVVNEFIGVNGVNYVYTDGQWGTLGQYFPLSAFHSLHPIESDFIVCPDLEFGPLTRVGAELLNDERVDHFRITEGADAGPVANVGGGLSVGYTMATSNAARAHWTGGSLRL